MEGISAAEELPDVYEYFQIYDQLFFDSTLGCVELKWSSRMTLCAGICELKHGMITVKLSEPLLKFRSGREILETLLHEMIHAKLFLTGDNFDHDGHGPPFLLYMS
jgi:hypothetical protein